MFYAIFMTTTNKISIEYTKKEMRRETEHVTIKNQLNSKKAVRE